MRHYQQDAQDQTLVRRVHDFVRDTIIPYEKDARCTSHGFTEGLRIELNQLAREAGLLSVHVEKEWGGAGLNQSHRALVFEAAGYSVLGPIAMNCAAPDGGNMHLLGQVATALQKEKYLKPLVAATHRSCFAMTEPKPGAGADPGQLSTTAVWDGEAYIVSGHK